MIHATCRATGESRADRRGVAARRAPRGAWLLLAGLAAFQLAAGCSLMGRARIPRLDEAQRALNVESFEYAWTTIRDKHWDPEFNGVDWQAVHDELLPRVTGAETMPEARAAISDMISRLGQSHFDIIPPEAYDVAAEATSGRKGRGDAGLDARVIDGQALVTRIEPGSPAERAGVRMGWEILAIDDRPLAPSLERIAEQFAERPSYEAMLAGIVHARLSGEVDEKREVLLRDGEDREQALEIVLAPPKGNWAQVGNLPPLATWIETRWIDERIGWIAFNLFLDPTNLMEAFNRAMNEFMQADGIVIDVRGNPGGIGAMAMGMAGWFVDEKGRRLGTMHTRENQMNFVVTPRPQVYAGRLAILQDGGSGSTTEILVGGMKDIGRARLFGTRTAGAVLPAMIERLPNGDGFLYAVANYVSEGGAVLEGNGVLPDEEVRHTREALLGGHDLVLESALAWIRGAS